MFLSKKKKNNFEKIKEEISKLIDDGDFDSAISKFFELGDSYDKLVSRKKVEYEGDYNLIRDQLILYMKIKEIDFLISNNELEKLRLDLLFIESKVLSFNKASPVLLNYISEKYNHYLDVYNAMVHKEEFDSSLNNLYQFIELGEYSKALELFPSIFKSFEDLGGIFNLDPLLYDKLLSLKKDVEMRALKSKAYGKVAKVDTKLLKARLRK